MTDEVDVVRCPDCGAGNRVPRAARGTPRCGRCRTALPWVVPAGDEDYAEVVGSARSPVLIDLWAPWCGPCRMVAPVVERAAAEFAGRLKVVKVNIDSAPRTAACLHVSSIPTLLLLHRGQEVARQVGATGAAAPRVAGRAHRRPRPEQRGRLEGALDRVVTGHRARTATCCRPTPGRSSPVERGWIPGPGRIRR